MFEIGNSLREARLRQQLDFPEIEQATKVRAKYLKALEQEQFDALPAQTYVKGFLRAYAEYLGLDGQLYVDEYNSRYVVGEDEPLARVRRSTAGRHQRHVESRVVVLAIVAIAVVTALVIAAWKFGAPEDQQAIPTSASSAAKQQSGATRTRTTPARPAKARKPAAASLVLTASGGDCWLTVRKAGGKQVFAGTLESGKSIRFWTRKKLLISAGAPENLTAKLNGEKVRFPLAGAPSAAVVTAKGIAPAPAP